MNLFTFYQINFVFNYGYPMHVFAAKMAACDRADLLFMSVMDWPRQYAVEHLSLGLSRSQVQTSLHLNGKRNL